MDVDMSMRGTMLWFNETKDSGLISTEEGERLSVDGSGFAEGAKPQGRCAGKVVLFDLDDSGEQRQARNVRFPPAELTGRARRRGSR